MMRDYGTGSVTDETLRVWPRSEPLGQLLIDRTTVAEEWQRDAHSS